MLSYGNERVKIRDEGVVRNKAMYLALGVDADGCRDVLDLWIEQTERTLRATSASGSRKI